MSIGILSLAKLMKGAMGADELAEAFSAMGANATFLRLSPDQKCVEFENLWFEASEDGVEVMRIEVTTRMGDRFSGIFVMGKSASKVTGQPKFPLDKRES